MPSPPRGEGGVRGEEGARAITIGDSGWLCAGQPQRLPPGAIVAIMPLCSIIHSTAERAHARAVWALRWTGARLHDRET